MARIGVASSDWFAPDPSRGLSEEVWGGSGWARVGQYLPYLREQHEVIVGVLVWDKDHFVIRHEDETSDVDVVLMHRLMHKGLTETIALGRAAGQKIVNDLDDWYWGLDTSNAAFKASHPKYNDQEDRYSYKGILSKSDLLIVSTPYLADRVAEWVKADIVVQRNTVDVDRFSVREASDTTCPIVGWVGSTAHRSNDLETMRGILGPMKAADKIRLMHGGHHLQYPSYAAGIGVEEDDVLFKLPLSSHSNYPSLMKMDVGIVPLRVTPFNQAKSYIKGLEYAAAGIPFVAQSIDAYDELRNVYDIGLTAKSPKDWVRLLNRLRDPHFRKEMAETNLEMVKAHDVSIGAKPFVAAINSVIR
jgi:hypothetical protein